MVLFPPKFYDKRDDFDFDIVNVPFLDGDITRATSYGVYISQLIRFDAMSLAWPTVVQVVQLVVSLNSFMQ